MLPKWHGHWDAEGDAPAISGCPQPRGNGSRRWEARLAFGHCKQPAALLITSAMLPRLATLAVGRRVSGA